MNGLSNNETILFFLQLTDDLPVNFFYLTTHFSEMNITLIPIRPRDLMSLKLSSREFVLNLQTDSITNKNFMAFRKRFLDFALLNRKIHLFDMSSFSKIDIASKLEYFGIYNHFALPTKIASAVEQMSAIIYKDKRKEAEIWPGGNSPKLSIDGLS